MNILYIPLDERPCNYKYPQQIVAEFSDISIIVPDKSILNHKKSSGDLEKLWQFLESNIENAHYAIISMDMLIYGGLLPSRLHNFKEDELLLSCERLRNLKIKNPNIKIFAFDLIMRVPAYNSSEEEPDYYSEFGENIFNISWLRDKIDRGHGFQEDKDRYENLLKNTPKEYGEDYFSRREKNYKVTERLLSLVQEGVFNYFVIPQDDAALYGVQSQEQGKHRETIKNLGIGNKVLLYPGADEVGCTLVARVLNDYFNKIPSVFVRFSSLLGPTIIPKYEDRPYMETIKAHIISCGMNIADNSVEADLVLMVNTPGIEMQESWEQTNVVRTNYSHRNLNEFVVAAKNYISKGKKVMIADVAYSNGSDLELIDLMVSENILEDLSSYGGWNTNGNTLGTVLSAGVVSFYGKADKEFLIYRLVEDCAYQALVRQQVIKELPEQGIEYYNFKDKTQWVENRTKELLNDFINNKLIKGFKDNDFSVSKVEFPWKRMFEVDLDICIGKK